MGQNSIFSILTKVECRTTLQIKISPPPKPQNFFLTIRCRIVVGFIWENKILGGYTKNLSFKEIFVEKMLQKNRKFSLKRKYLKNFQSRRRSCKEQSCRVFSCGSNGILHVHIALAKYDKKFEFRFLARFLTAKLWKAIKIRKTHHMTSFFRQGA